MATEAEKRAQAMQNSSPLARSLGVPSPAQGVGADLARQMQSRGIGTPDAEADADDPYILTRRGNIRTGGWSLGEQRRLSDLEKNFFKMGAGDLKKLQKRLEAGGFFDSSYRLGVHDEATMKAYSLALSRASKFYASDNEVTLDEVIDSGAGAQEVGGGEEVQAFQPTVSNTDQLRETVRKVSTLVAGQYLPDNVVEGIVTQFQQQEIEAQRRKYDLAVTNETGAIEDAPTAEFNLEQQVRKADPAAAGAYDLSERAKVLTEMLGGLQ